jgi:hypothetical protein
LAIRKKGEIMLKNKVTVLPMLVVDTIGIGLALLYEKFLLLGLLLLGGYYLIKQLKSKK